MKLLLFFRLIRWKNLLFILFTLLLFKYILIPKFVVLSVLTDFDFALFCASILFITASGYLINDVFDHKIDRINKNHPIIIGTSISLEKAKIWYYVIVGIGLIIGFFASFRTSNPLLNIYFIGTAVLLYFYSKNLKAIPLIGNFVVALLIGLGIFTIGLFEQLNWNSLIFNIIKTYSLFGFGINFIREILKDIEDINGDFYGKLKTLPILIGRKRTNLVLFILSILFTIFSFVILILNKNISVYIIYYGVFMVIVPLVYFVSKLYQAKSKQDYKLLSKSSKVIMLLGILSIFTL